MARLNTRAEKIACYREFYDYPDKFNHKKGCPLPSGPVSIELRDVWYRYDGACTDTLKGISLQIKAGEKLALVGQNGSGKTTLLRCLNLLEAADSGSLTLGGEVFRNPGERKRYPGVQYRRILLPDFRSFPGNPANCLHCF